VRWQVFQAARDCFASRYSISDPAIITPPARLDHPEFTLTLTLHMAALVAVDSHSRALCPPADPTRLSGYLLDRERRHWTALFENRIEGLEFETPPVEMARAVFTGALVGSQPHTDATVLVENLGFTLHPLRLFADHAACYPPAQPGTALEPLYPDRLAEDFIALALSTDPGAADPWTHGAINELLPQDHEPPTYAARAITFLTAAAARWHHVTGHLGVVLSAAPGLAIVAGDSALTSLAALPDLDVSVLEAIEPHLPPGPSLNLNTGVAAITERLTVHRLQTTTEPRRRADLHATLAQRLADAGQASRAVDHQTEAVETYRQLTAMDPRHGFALGREVDNLAAILRQIDRWEDALTCSLEAIEILRRDQTADGAVHALAVALANHSTVLHRLGRVEDARGFAEKAVEHLRSLHSADPGNETYQADLARALSAAANVRHAMLATGQWLRSQQRGDEEAIVDLRQQALGLWRDLEAASPDVYASVLPFALVAYTAALIESRRSAEALQYADEAIELQRELVHRYPTIALRTSLVVLLRQRGTILISLERWRESLPPVEEALSLIRELREVAPDDDPTADAELLVGKATAHLRLGDPMQALPAMRVAVEGLRADVAQASPAREFDLGTARKRLAEAQSFLTIVLAELDLRREAVAASTEAVDLYRTLVAAFPATKFDFDLVGALDRQAGALIRNRRPIRAWLVRREARQLRRQLPPPPEAFIAAAMRALLLGGKPDRRSIRSTLQAMDLRTKAKLGFAVGLFVAVVMEEWIRTGDLTFGSWITAAGVAIFFVITYPGRV
jgi:tetratricopeptide (TPR) repeat protein